MRDHEDAQKVTPERDLSAQCSECWCCGYEPLPSQGLFFGRTERFKGFSGPVGSGKSAALCMEVVALANLNAGRQGLIGAPTLGMLRDATQIALLALLDKLEIEFELKKSDGEVKLSGTGSTILMRSLDDPERLRGTNLAWFGLDELSYSSEQSWLRLEARLRDPKAFRLAGLGSWTPQGHDWVYKRFVKKPVNGYGCVLAKPFENRFLLESTPDYYERLKESYDPKFYQQEALGEYVNSRADRVYHCFVPEVHVVKQEVDWGKPLLWALDFNVAPMCSVIAQRRGDKLVVVDEIYLERATTRQACEEFVNKFGRHIAGVGIYGDASGKAMKTSGKSDYQLLTDHLLAAGFRTVKMHVPDSNPGVMRRVQKVNAQLSNAYGEVKLEVDGRCKELIKDLEEVLFLPDSGVIDKNRDPLRTHMSDALGYLIWELFEEKPTIGEVGRRIL